MTTTEITIPKGFKKNAKGNLVLETNIRDIDIARDDLVVELIEGAREAQEVLTKYKKRVFSDISAFVELAGERWDAKVGGDKGNVTLYSYDGRYKIQRSISEHLRFDEGIEAAKTLIHECLDEWSKDANDNLKALVDRAFEMDKDGNLSTNRILGLRRMKIEDVRWCNAMDAISESIQVIGSKSYIRVYERVGVTDKYEPISLDLAGV